MIYLDHAATSWHKPPEVVRAVTEAMQGMGNPGRGAHAAALGAGRIVYETRRKLAELFGAQGPACVAFTANATESLNIAICGVLEPGDHVITTALEHNSVLRPLYRMEQQGVALTILPCDAKGRMDPAAFAAALRPETKLIVCTHGSNLTGNLVDVAAVGALAHRNGVLFAVDASQTAGAFALDVQKMHIDILCFTGHKSLLGPQGTGGLVVRPGVAVRPLLVGGSGVQSYRREHPAEMPTALEAGTLNAHGIAGLGAAVDFLQRTGLSAIQQKEQALMWAFYEGVRAVPGVTVYGDFGEEAEKTKNRPLRCPIVSLNIRDYDSGVVSDALYEQYGICTRPGAHCAPLMHRALGTVEQGAVRFSFGYGNTMEEVQTAITAVRELAREE